MTSLPHAAPAPPGLSLHLADLSLNPLLSSAASGASPSLQSTSPRFQALTSLTTSALAAHTSASRLGLGAPQRIMIDTHSRGPVVLHSFLDPQAHLHVQHAGLLGALHDVGGDEEPATPLLAAAEPEAAEHEHLAGETTQELTNGMQALQLSEPSVGIDDTASDAAPVAPMLVATVAVESYSRVGEARRMARRLEAVGREFQERWVREREEEERTERDEVEDREDDG